MASVERVYKAVRDIANKDQRGFVTPAIFNEFAGMAQMNVFNSLFEEMTMANRLRRGQLDGPRQFARFKQIEEDLCKKHLLHFGLFLPGCMGGMGMGGIHMLC